MNPRNVVLALLSFAPLSAQLGTPNEFGVALGHVHLNVRDIEAQAQFLSQFSGKTVHNGKLVMVQMPGIYIILRKQDPTAPAVGSIVDHFGFRVRSLAEWMPKWEAAGLKLQRGTNTKQVLLFGPDDIEVEILEDPTSRAPLTMHQIHMYAVDPLAIQAWYVKNFGAIPGRSGENALAIFSEGEISVGKSDTVRPPTKGRLIDHIGFEIRNLTAFAQRLQSVGIQLENPGVRDAANVPNLRVAFLTDPWGTLIELTQGLTPAQSAAQQ